MMSLEKMDSGPESQLTKILYGYAEFVISLYQ